ncbi:FlgN protein [Roseovarius halotolerans]|uniref:FlgN protein n=1 Tax=Roseovarius halotolerans TaxID=505353 RepID=A0A1X6Z1Z8_9RHOB|nr:flagellar export chaperone FlgN [Roseovarius halotolerans]RKT32375.1 FlgN protein [Roseovarius halotolerans]SLN38085.1 FlgN protein [Roseovarius halotolerans]
MTQDEMQKLIDRLDKLLETERTALLAGDLEAIGALLAQKEQLIDRFNALEGAREPDLAGLQGKVERNQVLLDGALEGIRRVANRMAAIRQVRRSLATYDETGKRHTIDGTVLRKVEKRA